jgi:membrane fusion protein, multidrug efflux system
VEDRVSEREVVEVEWEGGPEELPGAKGPAAAAAPRSGATRWIGIGLGFVALLAGTIYAVRTVTYYQHHAVTDDAQIEAHINPVLTRVQGYVQEVRVADNQHVPAGTVLVRIDERDLRSRVTLAEAAVTQGRAAEAAARSGVELARVARERARDDFARYAPLRQKGELSQQQYDAARSADEAAAAQLEMARRQVDAAAAGVAQAGAGLEAARLQLSYATIVAPVAGVVSRKSVETGQLVQPGQPLMALVENPDSWVVANFKETQLRRMRVGQDVTFEVDAYPGDELHGRIESIAAATGAKFALLPPDNATGNFTKVVQRVPVRITLTDPADPAHPLRAGMSVKAVVHLD